MLIPVIVHKDGQSDYGVTIPDFPGVFSGGETLEEALHNVQDALALWFCDDEVCRLPPSSSLDKILAHPDARTGAIALVEIDPSAFGPDVEATASIIVPFDLKKRIDEAALEKGLTIAEYLRQAIGRMEDKSHEAGGRTPGRITLVDQ